MNRSASPLKVFHRTGARSAIEAETGDPRALRPALYGAYRDLSRLRFDFPLVFNATRGREPWVLSLTEVFDRVIRETCPPGPAGDEPRRQLLAQEQAIRSLLAQGKRADLARLWKLARRKLGGSRKKALKQVLRQAQAILPLDGAVCQCDRDLAAELIGRAWQASEARKARILYRRISRLVQKLGEILEVDDRRAATAFAAERLESSVGAADRNVFDFAVMSKLLGNVRMGDRLPARRRQRIEATIHALESQRFVGGEDGNDEVFDFRFSSCRAALAAFRARLPHMATLVRAIGIAELEVENHYDETLHDRFFADFGSDLLGPADFGLFPSYLLCLRRRSAEFRPEVMRLLSAGLPFKIVAQFGEFFGDEDLADGGLALGTRAQQPAHIAIGLNHAFVLQASNASLYRLRDAVMRGVAGNRPALFSIYAGSDYLDGAAATESRAFPCLVYDPDAGPTQAHRFSLAGNPVPAQDWTNHILRCEGPDHELRSYDTSFSLVDFIAADDRFAAHFAEVAENDRDDDMLHCVEFLQLQPELRSNRLPCVLLLDAENRLLRAVVDEKLIDAALRCRDVWRNLRELAGIDNSHAFAAVDEARRAWEAERADQAERQGVAAQAETAPSPENAIAGDSPSPLPEAPVEEAMPATDDPWIETLRCTSCNECTLINDRMFAYDDDLRAYIADPDAGTYRELVEAAESCQVAIIHPGQPRNPDEPGLDELAERARPFL